MMVYLVASSSWYSLNDRRCFRHCLILGFVAAACLLVLVFQLSLELLACFILESVLLSNIVYFETEDAWFVSFDALCGKTGRVDLEQHVRERSAKVGTIDGGMTRGLWVVDVLAARTIQFDCFRHWDVRQTNR